MTLQDKLDAFKAEFESANCRSHSQNKSTR